MASGASGGWATAAAPRMPRKPAARKPASGERYSAPPKAAAAAAAAAPANLGAALAAGRAKMNMRGRGPPQMKHAPSPPPSSTHAAAAKPAAVAKPATAAAKPAAAAATAATPACDGTAASAPPGRSRDGHALIAIYVERAAQPGDLGLSAGGASGLPSGLEIAAQHSAVRIKVFHRRDTDEWTEMGNVAIGTVSVVASTTRSPCCDALWSRAPGWNTLLVRTVRARTYSEEDPVIFSVMLAPRAAAAVRALFRAFEEQATGDAVASLKDGGGTSATATRLFLRELSRPDLFAAVKSATSSFGGSCDSGRRSSGAACDPASSPPPPVWNPFTALELLPNVARNTSRADVASEERTSAQLSSSHRYAELLGENVLLALPSVELVELLRRAEIDGLTLRVPMEYYYVSGLYAIDVMAQRIMSDAIGSGGGIVHRGRIAVEHVQVGMPGNNHMTNVVTGLSLAARKVKAAATKRKKKKRTRRAPDFTFVPHVLPKHRSTIVRELGCTDRLAAFVAYSAGMGGGVPQYAALMSCSLGMLGQRAHRDGKGEGGTGSGVNGGGRVGFAIGLNLGDAWQSDAWKAHHAARRREAAGADRSAEGSGAPQEGSLAQYRTAFEARGPAHGARYAMMLDDLAVYLYGSHTFLEPDAAAAESTFFVGQHALPPRLTFGAARAWQTQEAHHAPAFAPLPSELCNVDAVPWRPGQRNDFEAALVALDAARRVLHSAPKCKIATRTLRDAVTRAQAFAWPRAQPRARLKCLPIRRKFIFFRTYCAHTQNNNAGLAPEFGTRSVDSAGASAGPGTGRGARLVAIDHRASTYTDACFGAEAAL